MDKLKGVLIQVTLIKKYDIKMNSFHDSYRHTDIWIKYD
jgi:hypothetical protein